MKKMSVTGINRGTKVSRPGLHCRAKLTSAKSRTTKRWLSNRMDRKQKSRSNYSKQRSAGEEVLEDFRTMIFSQVTGRARLGRPLCNTKSSSTAIVKSRTSSTKDFSRRATWAQKPSRKLVNWSSSTKKAKITRRIRAYAQPRIKTKK